MLFFSDAQDSSSRKTTPLEIGLKYQLKIPLYYKNNKEFYSKNRILKKKIGPFC